MSGSTATVILRSPFTLAHTGLVAQLLREHTSKVSETRKGRHWDFTDGNSRASLTVFETDGRAEFEEDLLDAGLLPDNAPEIVVIAYPLKADRDSCGRLAELVAKQLSGLSLGVANG